MIRPALIILIILISTIATSSDLRAGQKCTSSDFKIKSFKLRIIDNCQRTPCPELRTIGELFNNCRYPAGAEIQVVARDKNGDLVDVIFKGWPASIKNIPPGGSYPFSISRMIDVPLDPTNKYTIQIIDVRQWK